MSEYRNCGLIKYTLNWSELGSLPEKLNWLLTGLNFAELISLKFWCLLRWRGDEVKTRVRAQPKSILQPSLAENFDVTSLPHSPPQTFSAISSWAAQEAGMPAEHSAHLKIAIHRPQAQSSNGKKLRRKSTAGNRSSAYQLFPVFGWICMPSHQPPTSINAWCACTWMNLFTMCDNF